MVFHLASEVKNYDWGDPSVISNFLGLAPTGLPEAEIWWGNHPTANCNVETVDGSRSFASWLNASGLSFHFLVKLLAVRKTLSIQAHPNRVQAAAGFHAENSSGIPIADPMRNFRDSHAKPELLISLTDGFIGMAGFVSEAMYLERIQRWLEAGAPESLKRFLAKAVGDRRKMFNSISARDGLIMEILNDLVMWLAQLSLKSCSEVMAKEIGLMRKVCADHPLDPAALAVPMMHHIYLRRGEALFVPEREVHAYVQGFGLEIMLPSDNVVRAGLTSKNVNPDSFVELANFEPSSKPQVFSGANVPEGKFYQSPGADLAGLNLVTPGHEVLLDGSALCLMERGSVEVFDGTGRTIIGEGSVVFLEPGASLLLPDAGSSAWIVQSRGI